MKRYWPIIVASLALAAPAGAATVERPPVTVFHGDGNYTKASRPASAIRLIVIHVTEGRFWGSVDWLRDRHAHASANYVVSRAGKIVQLVHLSDIAWHSGNAEVNRESVGIEHAGVTDDPAGFTMRQYRASAQLAAWLCRRSLIPIDRKHIVGHSEVPGTDHTDPGRYWSWPLYLDLVRHYAFPKPFPRLHVESTTVYSGQTVAGNVPWGAETTGPKATRVDFLVDGRLRWSDHRAPFTYAAGRPLHTLALRNGRHALRMVAYGRSGHSAGKTVVVRVLNRPLELTTAGIRRHAQVAGVVRLRAATTVPTAGVRLYLDGRLVQQALKQPFAFRLDVRKVVNGTHTLDLRTTDFLGRRATHRIPVVVANPLPPVPPTFLAQSLVDGQTLQGAVPWVVDARGTIARVDFLVDGAVRGSLTAPPFSFAWNTAAELPGPHQLVVRVVGRDGKVAASPPIGVTVAASSPPSSS